MADVRHWLDVVGTNGYELLGDFVLPAWECYTPMQERLRILAAKYAGDVADAEAVLKEWAPHTATTECILATVFW
jgi:hypothetical protein